MGCFGFFGSNVCCYKSIVCVGDMGYEDFGWGLVEDVVGGVVVVIFVVIGDKCVFCIM